MNPEIGEILSTLPERPGVYIMKSEGGAVIYVGKARSLKSRVRSYFSSGDHDVKTAAMVSNINDIEYIITASEHEAFILENALIKKYRPRYNIMFKDDKTYPFIKLTVSEEWPRAILCRRVLHDKDEYYGPYADQWSVRVILKLAQDVFNIRSCNLNISSPRRKPCLQYHIGRCKAPCVRYISENEYLDIIRSVRQLIKGDYEKVTADLIERMKKLSAEFKFEKAALVRDQLKSIENISKKQNIVCADLKDRDIIVEARGNIIDVVELFAVRGGALLGHKSFAIENDVIAGASLLDDFVVQYYQQQTIFPDEIISSTPLSHETVEFLSEFAGNAKKIKIIASCDSQHQELAATAHKNALNTLKIKENEKAEKMKRSSDALGEITSALELAAPPERIECYDISNISGTLAVGSMVVAIGGNMQRSEYRKFKIKTVDQIDDYRMMKEVLTRRFRRAIEEGQKLPDLVMIDGGVGHLSAACEAISALSLASKISLCSIAKQNEDIFIPGRVLPAPLGKKSPGQFLLMRIRDEAHRFAVTYHKKLRKGKMTLSVLSEIEGLGKTRISALYDHFETIERMRSASVEELLMVKSITRPIAQKVFDFFHK